MFCTRQKEEPYDVCANAAKTKQNQTENEKHSCARSENEPLWEFNVRKGRSRERSNTLSRLRFWTQPAGLNVGCDESDVSSFFFFKKKTAQKKRERSNSCSRANTPGPKTAGGQRLMHSSDSSLCGPTMTPRHPKNTSWGRRSRTEKW